VSDFFDKLSAGYFDAVKMPLCSKGLKNKPFDGGLSNLRRALPPQAPLRLRCFSLRQAFFDSPKQPDENRPAAFFTGGAVNLHFETHRFLPFILSA